MTITLTLTDEEAGLIRWALDSRAADLGTQAKEDEDNGFPDEAKEARESRFVYAVLRNKVDEQTAQQKGENR